jgi:transcriptional regulator GlxA family with amidase domain
MHKVSRAIYLLQSELDQDMDVGALAKAASMSRSTFFAHFKEITAMSPIQYQKRLRLHEARRLMLELGHSAERSSFEVGYRSPSQFSREYARMFGILPGRDTGRIKSQVSGYSAVAGR